MNQHNPPEAAPPRALVTPAAELAEPRDVLRSLFSLFDRLGVRYCLARGYEGLPEAWGSDVDIIVARRWTGAGIAGLIAANARSIGTSVLDARGLFFTLECRPKNGLPQFLFLDLSHDDAVGGQSVQSGEALLEDRRRWRGVWIAAARHSFDCQLTRSILCDALSEVKCRRLTALFAEDPEGCAAELEQRWPKAWCATIAEAVRTGNWNTVQNRSASWRRRLMWRSMAASPVRSITAWASAQFARFDRLLRPRGLHIGLLGPDGAGKSSTIAALENGLAPLYAATEDRGFVPSLKRLLGRSASSTATPHALKPRTASSTVLRLSYWTAYALLSNVTIWWSKARSRLILNDRPFLDILVDPVRYRYDGPRWILRLIWYLSPKPDVLLLLHGPAATLQARKKELTLAETERQCRDYLTLVEPLPNGHVVNAAQPLEQVMAEVWSIIKRTISNNNFPSSSQ